MANTRKTTISRKTKAASKSTNRSTKVAKTSKQAPKKVTKTATTTEDALKYAIVRRGKHQFYLELGKTYEIPRIDVPEGKEFVFEEVLAYGQDDDKFQIGTPVVKGVKVKVFVVKQLKGKKAHGFKYKAKSRYRRQWGYRTPMTRIKVLAIG